MMATSENGAEMSNDIDIDALIMPDVNESEVSAVVDSLQQELTGSSTQSSIKTEGETTKPSVSAPLTLNLTSSTTSTDSTRKQSLSLMSPFGGIAPPQTPLTPSSQLITSEEQTAIHKQAGLLAIHTYCAKHGQTKAKEILDGVTKVKNFLTNLIQLASKSGRQVHSSVHSLVQKLVGGTIDEEEFASKIEDVLKSKHQPNLVPFLKTSIADLRQHILLQRSLMKQLMEKKIAERRLQETQQQATPPAASSSTPSPQQATPTSHQATPPPPETGGSPQSSTTTPTINATPTSSLILPHSLSSQQQQLIKNHLSKLPEAQQKLYLEQIKKELEKQRKAQLQLILKQKQHLATAAAKQPVNLAGSNTMTPQQQQQLSALLKQQELIKQQQKQAMSSLGGVSQQPNSSSPKKGGSLLSSRNKMINPLLNRKTDEVGVSGGRGKVPDNEEEEEEGMDIAGVNLKEETAHFLPSVPETVSRSVTDRTFLDIGVLRRRITVNAQLHGISDVSEDAVTYFSHAVEERLKNLMDKLTAVSQHRSDSLKEDGHYQITNDVRGQLKVLGKIDQISVNRREEKEKEMIFKAAKSRSKQDDPELAKKKEQAKQIQLAQEREIHQKAANETALAAIGRRKRTANTAFGESSASSPKSSDQSLSPSSSKSSSSAAIAAVFTSPGSSRKQKRKILSKDVLFVMEQEKETKKSLLLYKSLLH